MIVIIDCGMGNIQAFLNVYKSLHIPVNVAKTVADLVGATRLILPGVGAFDHAMDAFNRSGMRPEVERLVFIEKIPILGVCVGMQMLADISDEGTEVGLGWVSGRVTSFTNYLERSRFPTPHMGWNDVVVSIDNPLFKGVSSNARFYFLHSYFFECLNECESIATVNYGLKFSCAVVNENVYGVQFHPEKSHSFGSLLLKNFSEI